MKEGLRREAGGGPDGLAYFGDNHGVLSTLYTRNGALVSRVSGLEKPPGIVGSYPALAADGTLLIGSDDGLLYAIGS